MSDWPFSSGLVQTAARSLSQPLQLEEEDRFLFWPYSDFGLYVKP